MPNSAVLRLVVLSLFTVVGIAAISHEPTLAAIPTGRTCSISATPMAPIVAVATPVAPIAPPAHRRKTLLIKVTGYTSTEDQTDGDPCIIRHRINICQLKREGRNICASNVFREGTQVSIEGIAGVCTVMDTMPRDKKQNIDVYFGQDPKDDPKGPLWEKAMAVGNRYREVTVISTP